MIGSISEKRIDLCGAAKDIRFPAMFEITTLDPNGSGGFVYVAAPDEESLFKWALEEAYRE